VRAPLAEAERASVEADARERRGVADGGTREEELLEHRARGEGELPEVLVCRRDLAPAEHCEVLGCRDPLDSVLLSGALIVVARKEHHARGILPHRRQLEVHHGAKELVGHLGQDAGAVTGSRIRPDRPAMLEIAKGRQSQVDDVVSGFASQGGDHGKATGVFLECRVVHALLAGESRDAGLCGGHRL
jgi:hypothetical protein